MHTAHIVLVKADSHDDAIGTIRAHLNNDNHFASGWSDWAIVGDEGFGASRFSFRNLLDSDSDSILEWDGASSYAVSRDDEADLFSATLNRFYGYRQQIFDELYAEAQENGFYFSLDQDDTESWKLYRLTQLAESVYCPDSKVYDLEHYSANLRSFHEDIAQDGRDWYAVLVDFHF